MAELFSKEKAEVSFIELPVAASVKCEFGNLAVLNASGDLIGSTDGTNAIAGDTTGYRAVGLYQQTADNLSGAAEAILCEVLPFGPALPYVIMRVPSTVTPDATYVGQPVVIAHGTTLDSGNGNLAPLNEVTLFNTANTSGYCNVVVGRVARVLELVAGGRLLIHTPPFAGVPGVTQLTKPAATGSTTSTPYGYTTSAQADAIVTDLNLVIDAIRKFGIPV